MLWPRGNQIRQSGLAYYNRFVTSGNRTERCLLSKIISSEQGKVSFTTGWEAQLEYLLQSQGKAILVFDLSQRTQISVALACINTLFVDLHGLIVYPRVARIKREVQSLHIYVEIAEVIQ